MLYSTGRKCDNRQLNCISELYGDGSPVVLGWEQGEKGSERRCFENQLLFHNTSPQGLKKGKAYENCLRAS
jgi:hypothetical protein